MPGSLKWKAPDLLIPFVLHIKAPTMFQRVTEVL